MYCKRFIYFYCKFSNIFVGFESLAIYMTVDTYKNKMVFSISISFSAVTVDLYNV